MMRFFLALLLALLAIPVAAQDTPEAAAQQVLATERAFDAAAERDGQWTAFRAFAASDATMFAPGPVNAQTWLAGRTDPPHSVRWQPHRVIIACDGTLAATTGNAQWPDGRHSRYTTIWRRQADGSWRWIADDGAFVDTATAEPAEPAIEEAECPGATGPDAFTMPLGEVGGASRDNTLVWGWIEGRQGGLSVTMWIGPRYAMTIHAGPPRP